MRKENSVRSISMVVIIMLFLQIISPLYFSTDVSAAWDGYAGSDEKWEFPLFDFSDLQSFVSNGMEPSNKYTQDINSYSVLWDNHMANGKITFDKYPLGVPTDWTDCNGVELTMYSTKATNAPILAVIYSSPSTLNEIRYYMQYVYVDWVGWKKIKFNLSEMETRREPDITDMTGGFELVANGSWNLVGNPETELYISSLKLIGEKNMYNFTQSYYNEDKISTAISMLKDSVAVYGDGANAVTDEGKIPLEYEIDYINETVMVPIDVFKEFLGASVCGKNNGYSIQLNGKTVWGKENELQVNVDSSDTQSESFTLSQMPYVKDEKMYVPGEEIAKLLGLSAFSDGRLLCMGTSEMYDALRRPLNMGVNEYNEIVSQTAYEKYIDLESFVPADTKVLKDRWRGLLVGDETTNDITNDNIKSKITAIEKAAEKARGLLIKENPGRTIFSDYQMTTSSHLTYSYRYVVAMAKAYACYGSKYYHDKTLFEDIIFCLDWLTENYYSAAGSANWTYTTYDGWWDWQIGAPIELVRTLICIYDELTPEQISGYLEYHNAKYSKPHPSGGANQADTCLIIMGSALLQNNYKKIFEMNTDLLEVYLYGDDNSRHTETEGYLVRDGKPIEIGTGFFTDGSYVFHYLHPMNAQYGYHQYNASIDYETIVAGTKFDLNNSLKYNIPEFFFNSFDTINYGTSIFPSMRARFANITNNTHAVEYLVKTFVHAENYDEATKNELYAIVKDTYLDTPNKAVFIEYMPMSYVLKFEQMIADDSIKAREEVKQSKTFYNMDRVVHKRDNWAFDVAMSSSRIFNYESIASINTEGWYQGDGRTEWLLKDTNMNVTSAYWESIDPYRLPGTTVDTQTRKKATVYMGNEYLSSKDFVGGVSLNNEYSIATMELESYHSDIDFGVDGGGYGGKNPAHKNDLTAKKSYFMTDDAVICLGTDVNATDNNNAEVLTIVENILSEQVAVLSENSVSFPEYEIQSVDGDVEQAENVPANTIDENYFSKWAGIKDQFVVWDLGEVKTLGFINLAFTYGHQRTQQFELLISSDGTNWESVFDGASGGKTEDDEAFDLKGKSGRYIKFVNKGNSAGSEWVSLTEMSVYPPNSDGSIGVVADEVYGNDPVYSSNGELDIRGEDVDMKDITWANYNNICGYWFPTDNKTSQLGSLKTRRTKGTSSCLEIWYSHGVNPDKGGYAYALLPGADAEYTKAFAESGNVEILSNNGKVQAIRDKRTNTTYIVFWQAGEFEGIKLSSPGLVIARETDSTYEIAVSDPTHKLTSNSLKINKVLTPAKLDEFASAESDGQYTTISYDMTYLPGRTFECVFEK